MNRLSPLLLEIYRVARTAPSPEFKQSALEAIKHFLPFDSALWGTFAQTARGAIVHAGYLYNQPARMMEEYEAIKQYDFLNRQCLSRPGHTVQVNASRLSADIHPLALRHMRRFGMEQVLSTVMIDRVLNLCTAVSLYRASRHRPFSETERRLKQQIMPHLVEAWNFNTILYVARRDGLSVRFHGRRALVDRDGILHNAEPGFAASMRAEFPAWEGPRLPDEVTGILVNGGLRSFTGTAMVISTLRDVEDGLLLTGVRPLSPVDRLSSRELAVSREFAAGRTHKEIASTLGVSPATVRNQLQSAYGKLGVNTKIGLAEKLKDSEPVVFPASEPFRSQ